MNQNLSELRLPLPLPPPLAAPLPSNMPVFESFSTKYALPFSKTSPVSTVTSDETSETDEHAVPSSEDTLSVKSAFQQVKSSKEDDAVAVAVVVDVDVDGARKRSQKCAPVVPPDKRARVESRLSVSPVDLRSESCSPRLSPHRSRRTEKQIKAKPKVWRPY